MRQSWLSLHSIRYAVQKTIDGYIQSLPRISGLTNKIFWLKNGVIMLKSPSSTGSAWPLKNHTSFDTYKILQLAQYFISADTKDIYIKTADEDALKFLEYAVLTFQPSSWVANDLIPEFEKHIRQIFEKINPSGHEESVAGEPSKGKQKEERPRAFKLVSKPADLRSIFDAPVISSQSSREKSIGSVSDASGRGALLKTLALDLGTVSLADEAVVTSDLVIPKIAKMPTEVEWSVLVKLAFKDGQILDEDSKDATAAWNVLIDELSQLSQFYLKHLKDLGDKSMVQFDSKHACSVLTNFIGQLVAIGKTQSAEMIHLYLHLMKKAYDKSEINDLDSNKVGLALAATIGYGLNIIGYLRNEDIDYVLGSDLVLERDMTRNQLGFLKCLFKGLLDLKIFNHPFDVSDYTHLRQKNFMAMRKVVAEAAIGIYSALRVSPRDMSALLVQLSDNVDSEVEVPAYQTEYSKSQETKSPRSLNKSILTRRSSSSTLHKLFSKSKQPDRDEREKTGESKMPAQRLYGSGGIPDTPRRTALLVTQSPRSFTGDNHSSFVRAREDLNTSGDKSDRNTERRPEGGISPRLFLPLHKTHTLETPRPAPNSARQLHQSKKDKEKKRL